MKSLHSLAEHKNIPNLAGRILIAPLFLASAAIKIMSPGKVEAMVTSAGLPMASVGVWLAAAIEIALPLMIITGYRARLAAWALAAYCILTALLFHADWAAPGQLMNFLKNVAIAGALMAMETGAGKDSERQL